MLGKYSLSSRFGRVLSVSREDERLLLFRGVFLMGVDVSVSLIVSYFIYKVITKFLVFPTERGFYCRDVQDLSSPCFLLAVIVNQLCKCAVGRLRPNFLSVCNPQWEKINCSSGETWIADAFCRGPPKAVKKARTRNGYCLVTRITDMWHYPSDVVWGALIGFVIAYVFFMRRVCVDYRKFHSVKGHWLFFAKSHFCRSLLLKSL
uniref:AcidPPc domain-containing protein n=1 Tax=Ascaris lumbricoides TaxID=6252 RepID=A0A0M3HPM1_ASCLU